jgi:hypothetical protein
MKKAQSSTEFVVLSVFMFLFFIMMTIAVQNQLAVAQQVHMDKATDELANIINNEVLLSTSVNTGYERTFFLPTTINNQEYQIELPDPQELVVVVAGKKYVYFLDNASSTHFRPGYNIIHN